MYDSQVLDEAIRQQNLTNEKAAVKAGLAARTVSSLRKGEPRVNLDSLNKLAGALNLEIEIRFNPKTALGSRHRTLARGGAR